MRQYLTRRLLLTIPTLIGVSLVIFVLMRVIPGDVAVSILGGEGSDVTLEEVERLREELGLNKPLYEQYAAWLWGLVRLDLGNSLYTRQPIFDEIARRFPVTLQLALLATLFSALMGIPAGVISAIRQDTKLDYAMRIITIGGLAIPNFWLATLLIIALVLMFNWVPPLGFPKFLDDPLQNLALMFWPALVLGYRFVSYLSRMTRSCVLEVLRQDYVRTALSKGLMERVVMLRHVLPNALLPVVTVLGIEVAAVISGSVVVESIFSLPGVGSAFLHSINERDPAMVQNLVVVFALFVLAINLLVDLLYGILDPRVQLR